MFYSNMKYLNDQLVKTTIQIMVTSN